MIILIVQVSLLRLQESKQLAKSCRFSFQTSHLSPTYPWEKTGLAVWCRPPFPGRRWGLSESPTSSLLLHRSLRCCQAGAGQIGTLAPLASSSLPSPQAGLTTLWDEEPLGGLLSPQHRLGKGRENPYPVCIRMGGPDVRARWEGVCVCGRWGVHIRLQLSVLLC